MRYTKSIISCFIIAVLCGMNGFSRDLWNDGQVIQRGIPAQGVAQSHVFLESEPIVLSLSKEIAASQTWRLINDSNNTIQSGIINKTCKEIPLENPGIGWYRFEIYNTTSECVYKTTAAVLQKVSTPAPQDSPVCIDAALSWLADNNMEKITRMANLAALTGANWIRDRIRWRELEPADKQFAPPGLYDQTADIQNKPGLKILQVFHNTPAWAERDGEGGGFPPDLFDVYYFCKNMAERFHGKVQAWEPWNEANAPDFGGQTASEMCSYQKAAYLGFKAGNPKVTVGFNAYCGVPTKLHSQTLVNNEVWPYFDTYNFHSYCWPDSYGDLWGPILEAACGKPIWLTETDRGMKFDTPAPESDFTPEHDLIKAHFIAQEYALALFNGTQRVFHFVLPNYTESSGVQFGLLRHDTTPRPAYVALTAVGRFLAGGRCMGRYRIPDAPDSYVYAFSAKPDGKPRDVLIAWNEKKGDWQDRGKAKAEWKLPANIKINSAYDYLGREMDPGSLSNLTSSPVYLVLPKGDSKKLLLEKPMASVFRDG